MALNWLSLEDFSSYRSSHKAEEGNILLRSKVKLKRFLAKVIFLYVFGTEILTAELEKRAPGFEVSFYQNIISISYKNTNK